MGRTLPASVRASRTNRDGLATLAATVEEISGNVNQKNAKEGNDQKSTDHAAQEISPAWFEN
jgi:hypothetical protein